jgi:hypothetical protein
VSAQGKDGGGALGGQTWLQSPHLPALKPQAVREPLRPSFGSPSLPHGWVVLRRGGGHILVSIL